MTGKEYHYLLQVVENLEGRAKSSERDAMTLQESEPDAADRDKAQFIEGTANGLRLAIDMFRRTLAALNQ